MLYSVAASFGFYALVVYLIGLMVSMGPVMGYFLAFGVIALIGGYFARHSRIVSRLCYGIGGFCIAIYVVSEFLMPALVGQKALVITVAVILGVAIYGVTRYFTFRRYVRRRPDGNGHMVRPAPPFGREWGRWLFAFAM